MFGLGASELLIILLLVLVIFGAAKLPQLGRGLGEGIANFKRGLKADEKTPPASEHQLPHSSSDTTEGERRERG